MFKELFWCFLDPFLFKINSRIKHLEMIRSNVVNKDINKFACFDETVCFYCDSKLINYGKKEYFTIGSYTHIRGELSIVSPEGKLRIGNHCYIGEGTKIWAQQFIEIGNRVLIAHSVDIHDTNAHSLNAELRRKDPVNLFEKKIPIDWSSVRSKPVRIESDVWIGFKSSIMKGVTIGRGAVVAAGSVVTKDVLPYTLVAGNPSRFIRELPR
jgi:acetyltransferase-like isoleucine patch superfamily enzyme